MGSRLLALSPQVETNPIQPQTASQNDVGTFILPILSAAHELEGLEASLVASWHHSSQLVHSRRWHRVTYRKPVIITAMDDAGGCEFQTSRIANGRDVSLGGIAFEHFKPLPFRFMVVSLVKDGLVGESAVVRLTWCRFTREGKYCSGGYFLRTITAPIAGANDWQNWPAA